MSKPSQKALRLLGEAVMRMMETSAAIGDGAERDDLQRLLDALTVELTDDELTFFMASTGFVLDAEPGELPSTEEDERRARDAAMTDWLERNLSRTAELEARVARANGATKARLAARLALIRAHRPVHH